MLLAAVGVAAIDHQRTAQPGGFSSLQAAATGVVVGRLAAAQDDVAVGVALGMHRRHLAVLVHARKWCGRDAAWIASMAILILPSVPFLKPIGAEMPEASSRCTWLSARADGAPADQVADVLRRNHVEEFACAGIPVD
jgi:hypothetical protein